MRPLGPIVSFMPLIVIRNVFLLSKDLWEVHMILKILRRGWPYHSPWSVEICAAIPLYWRSIPISSELFRNSLKVNVVSLPNLIVSGKSVHTESQHVMKSFHMFLAEMSFKKVVFWNLVSVSTKLINVFVERHRIHGYFFLECFVFFGYPVSKPEWRCRILRAFFAMFWYFVKHFLHVFVFALFAYFF